jgi:hypothetical protein
LTRSAVNVLLGARQPLLLRKILSNSPRNQSSEVKGDSWKMSNVFA